MPSIFCEKKTKRPPDAFGNRKAFHQEMDEDFKFFNRAFKILLVMMILLTATIAGLFLSEIYH